MLLYKNLIILYNALMDFKTFFGVNQQYIKQNCIICQNSDVSLFSNKVLNGLFVKLANVRDITVIALKNNFLAGDTVLYLQDTVCKNIFLFGSCGGCSYIKHGDLVMIDKAYNLESFSSMLNFDKDLQYSQASKELFCNFYKKNTNKNLIRTNSACVASLYLETKFLNWFKEKEILAVDMESSIILSAAKAIKRKAVCLMYVTDLLAGASILDNDKSLKQKIANSRKELSKMILRFCNER
jgi:nucleoside phosphorylase